MLDTWECFLYLLIFLWKEHTSMCAYEHMHVVLTQPLNSPTRVQFFSVWFPSEIIMWSKRTGMCHCLGVIGWRLCHKTHNSIQIVKTHTQFHQTLLGHFWITFSFVIILFSGKRNWERKEKPNLRPCPGRGENTFWVPSWPFSILSLLLESKPPSLAIVPMVYVSCSAASWLGGGLTDKADFCSFADIIHDSKPH